jgi:hypothetical protein
MNLPSNFDTDIYRNNNNDLKHMNDNEAKWHYEKYGKNEGRICSKMINRDTLKSYINEKMSCLEIGPFDNPVVSGENVKYFDVLDRENLIKRSIECGRTYNNVPFINYVEPNCNLSIINDKFDSVLSCHSIEHQIDLIKHLNDVSNLLHQNGYYIVICPDKRYCFDHFIKETTIADVIDMSENKRNNHSIKSVIEHRALTCHNDAVRHWNNDHGEYNIDFMTVKNAINEFQNKNSYIDVHSMQFTSTSFEDIINMLYSLKYIDLKIEKIYHTIRNSCEFYAVLKKYEF